MLASVPCAKKLSSRSSVTAEVGASKESSRLTVFDRTNNIAFLIDTGSDVSILPATRRDKTKPPTPFLLHAANSTNIPTFDTRFLYVDFGLRRRFSWNLLVADVSTAIIGAVFLSHFRLMVDLKHRTIIDGTTKLKTTGGVVKTSLHDVTTINYDHPFRPLLEEFQIITRPSMLLTEVSHDVTHHIVTKGPPTACKARRMSAD
ncbi:uncharacterized protein LOC129761433 [Toxorhynchites rutilus septentrionalis]|uniref:uncharacterized protein LOC129761433 n=1 Tax=Toxorhynchites rutilus septentrionalis TaxID=329112 RepID=UPI00247909ED|nr:uncharacterized protein LOC129761433 [Toxorhynchites rutilus septentrionalis]